MTNLSIRYKSSRNAVKTVNRANECSIIYATNPALIELAQWVVCIH